MITKSMRYVDDLGRVVLPAHIRKNLNLKKGNAVSVTLDEDGTIRIRPEAERCCLCGKGVEGAPRTEVTIGPSKKLICYHCAQLVARSMMR